MFLIDKAHYLVGNSKKIQDNRRLHKQMAKIAPFRGLTYNFKKITDLAQIITPPYDIISEKEQEGYYNTHPNNIIRLELGKKMASDNDTDNRYTRAAAYLKEWEANDILIKGKKGDHYLTSHSYDPGDGSGTKVRWGFISLVKIEEEGSGVILPHEKTFSAHKDDRLKLLKACSTQLSQVFGLYDDARSGILDTLRKFTVNAPDASFTFTDGTGLTRCGASQILRLYQRLKGLWPKSLYL
jgi:uncharacterized protein (DUF1015 family)